MKIEFPPHNSVILQTNKFIILCGLVVGKMPSNSHNTISRSTQCYPCSSIWLPSAHGAIEQINRLTSEIRTAFEHREYCRAIFLDVSLAFNRVWLDGPMHKVRTHLPDYTDKLLESYLYNRVCAVR